MKKRKIRGGPLGDARERVLERPDGFYGQSEDGKEQYGPFPSLKDAVAAMNSAEESAYEPGETLEEAEEEIGISKWIDPDTGQPAEDSVPRIDDQDH